MIDDTILLAYVDGELGAEARAEMESAIASDGELAARAVRHAALRRSGAGAFAEALREPACEHRPLHAEPAPPASLWPWAAAVAASLMLGLAIGWGSSRLGPRITAIRPDGALEAAGPLARALDVQLTSPSAFPAPVKIGFTFMSRERLYCRTFTTRVAGGASGVACRDTRGWRLRLVTTDVPRPRLEQRNIAASQTPPEILSAVRRLAAGDPLDGEGETAARARGWRP